MVLPYNAPEVVGRVFVLTAMLANGARPASRPVSLFVSYGRLLHLNRYLFYDRTRGMKYLGRHLPRVCFLPVIPILFMLMFLLPKKRRCVSKAFFLQLSASVYIHAFANGPLRILIRASLVFLTHPFDLCCVLRLHCFLHHIDLGFLGYFLYIHHEHYNHADYFVLSAFPVNDYVASLLGRFIMFLRHRGRVNALQVEIAALCNFVTTSRYFSCGLTCGNSSYLVVPKYGYSPQPQSNYIRRPCYEST